ncbi:MAG: hypothetical protein PHC51_10705 [bacterium]|nr:hypothetical protein [bacterium]
MKKILLSLIYGIILALVGSALAEYQSTINLLPASAQPNAKQILKPVRELTICSQNLHRYGDAGSKGAKRKKQREYLTGRFVEAECDLVALQEVIGKTIRQSQSILDELVKNLNQRSGRRFVALTGPSNDESIRNAWLVDENKTKPIAMLSLKQDLLPKLQKNMPPAYYSRGPLLLRIEVPIVNGSKKLALINFHLKSKANSWKDPFKSQFEHLRLQMAAGLYNSASQITKSEPQTMVILAGDRNTTQKSPSHIVLSGKRPISDFSSSGYCRITNQAESTCLAQPPGLKQNSTKDRPLFMGAIQSQFTKEINSGDLGSYRFRGRYELIDEIYLPSDSLTPKQVKSGFAGKIGEGSDHLLVWTRLRLN